jgi:hypothetical protein
VKLSEKVKREKREKKEKKQADGQCRRRDRKGKEMIQLVRLYYRSETPFPPPPEERETNRLKRWSQSTTFQRTSSE